MLGFIIVQVASWVSECWFYWDLGFLDPTLEVPLLCEDLPQV